MFSKTILLSAFAAMAYAQAVSEVLYFTRVINPVTAGMQTAITYATNDTTSPVTILLKKGPSGDLKTVSTLTDSATNGQFIWTPSTSLENGVNYALEITQGTQLNYFGPFQIQGATGEGSSSSSSSSSMDMNPPSYGSHNATTTASGYPSMITSNSTMPSNTTMSHGNSTTTSSARRPSSTADNTNSAIYQGGSATTTGKGAAQTGAATMIGSSIALVFGAAAAVLMG
ncbi:extracellular matrix protein [Zymoseptoria brevis]|uniref:Extracellular matrix protein n=1 Tax=Zymoseptoria brevis TaxID=1047168 RepID=A0A0F4GID4_9PEZI|nr:extracellular matrix protein [Zymoseptoria brevis]